MKLLSGCLLSVFAMSAYAADAVKVIPPQNKVLASENGRFVFGQISEMRKDQYMLDTKTGRLWQIVEFSFPKNSDGTTRKPETMLNPIKYVDTSENMAVEPIPERAPIK